jgi:putative hydrolase
MASDPDDPFGKLPFFGDLARAMSGQGPVNWDVARQVAFTSAAKGATSEPNVDPASRIALERIFTEVDPHVRSLTGLSTGAAGRPPALLAVNRSTWAHHTLEAYRPIVAGLADALASGGGRNESGRDDGDDPMASLLSHFSSMMAPAMLGMAVGTLVGQLAQRAFGQYDLPLPREPRGQLLVVPATIDAFATDWSIELDHMRRWVAVHELVVHAVFSVDHVRSAVDGAVRKYVAGFRSDPASIAERMAGIAESGDDPSMALQQLLSDPTLLLGAVRSEEQAALAPALDAMVAALIGYVDRCVDTVAAAVVPSATAIGEAVRRRRIESGPHDRFVEQLLGLRLTRDQVLRGSDFVNGVIERAGNDGLARLFEAPNSLPTPSEVDAPGLWLARLGER